MRPHFVLGSQFHTNTISVTRTLPGKDKHLTYNPQSIPQLFHIINSSRSVMKCPTRLLIIIGETGANVYGLLGNFEKGLYRMIFIWTDCVMMATQFFVYMLMHRRLVVFCFLTRKPENFS